MARVLVGIPSFGGATPEVLADYLAWAAHVGKTSKHEVTYLVEGRQEQFRARNRICEKAIEWGMDYVLHFDDDQSVFWGDRQRPDFLDALVAHMEQDTKLGAVGALYYKREDTCPPCLFVREGEGYRPLRDDEVTGGLQTVDVAGGGALLLRVFALRLMDAPWFVPESVWGTDVQICRSLSAAGYRVAADTSLVLGHWQAARECVSPKTRASVYGQAAQANEELDPQWIDAAAVITANPGTKGLQYGPGSIGAWLQRHGHAVDVQSDGTTHVPGGPYDWAVVTRSRQAAYLAAVAKRLHPRGALFIKEHDTDRKALKGLGMVAVAPGVWAKA